MKEYRSSRHLLACIGIIGLILLWGASGAVAQVVCPPGTFPFVPGVCVLDGLTQPKFVNPVPDALALGFQYSTTFSKDDSTWPTRPPSIPGGEKPLYKVGMYQFPQDLGLYDPAALPALTPLAPVKVWGYGDATTGTGTYPGKTFIAHENQPLFVEWTNNLDDLSSLLPIDPTLTWADPCETTPTQGAPYDGPVPLVPHLHGGHTESLSDGLPDAWFLPAANESDCVHKRGSLYNIESLLVPGGDIYYYDNTQEAATVWYHDHALGITRTNVYAGLAGFYIIRDGWDTGVPGNLGGIDLPTWPYEQLLVIQDRMFEWKVGNQFELYYPTDAVLAGIIPNPDPALYNDWPGGPSALPEFFGNIILVNGQAWPFMNVEPRWYRLRLLNGSDSAFYKLTLKDPTGLAVPKIYQIGSDLGLLNNPVRLQQLVIGPGERADVLIDFTAHAGQQIIMRNSARQPYPKGATINPNTVGQIMAFNVGQTMTGAETFLWDKVAPLNLRQAPLAPPDPTTAVYTRSLVLFEGINSYGRLEPMLGTTALGGVGYRQPVTETPGINTTEIWEFYNTTPDAHPIHLHLVHFQILGRQKFSVSQDPITGAFLAPIKYIGKETAPQDWETGLKDTVQTYPGEVTRVIATFDKPCWYVWHCHILSHEDHEMMRPFKVVPTDPSVTCLDPVGQQQ